MAEIIIDKHVSLHQGITSEEGEPIYKMIFESLSKDEDVTLDFKDVTFLTTAFLNVVIGALYKYYTSEQLQKKLHVLNLEHLVFYKKEKNHYMFLLNIKIILKDLNLLFHYFLIFFQYHLYFHLLLHNY